MHKPEIKQIVWICTNCGEEDFCLNTATRANWEYVAEPERCNVGTDLEAEWKLVEDVPLKKLKLLFNNPTMVAALLTSI